MLSPKVTVIVTCYRHLKDIYATLDSIFMQTYPNIELYVSDDGTPDYEEKWEKIRQYIDENKTTVITNVKMVHLEQNVGTSKHANIAIRNSTGEYVKLLPPGDELFDPYVLERCVRFAEEKDARVVVGQTFVKRRDGGDDDTIENTPMYRWKARSGRLCNYTPSIHDLNHLRNLSCEKRNKIVASRPILSTISMFFRMDLLRETDGFPEQWRLIEDVAYWPKLAMMGEEFFISDIIMVKYALDGISNTRDPDSEFARDLREIFKTVYIPNEYRGGCFNRCVKRFRVKQIDWSAVSKRNPSLGTKIKYMDVILVDFCKNVKYLLIGSKL